MPANEWKAEQVHTFFGTLKKKGRKMKEIDPSQYKDIIIFACNLLDIPFPPNKLFKYFLIAPIAVQVLHQLTRYLPREESNTFWEFISSTLAGTSGPFIQLRELQINGYYPNIEFSRGNCHYLINQGYPFLITYNAGPASSSTSEVGWSTKNELRFAAAVACASTSHYHYFVFGYPLGLSLPYEYYLRVPPHLRHSFMIEWSRLNDTFQPTTGFYSRAIRPDFTAFQFSPFVNDISDFNKIFDKIRLSDNLLLRTLSYYVKCNMLWANPVFGEEAAANTLFALEGCLLLLQRKEGNQSRNIDLKVLESIFKKSFPRGEEAFKSVREAHATRIELVHPAPRWGTDWSPYLMADDFYAYRNAVKFYLNYILLDRILEGW